MNEQHFAYRIRQALEESTGRLPYRVTRRLERSRAATIARAFPDRSVATLSVGPAATLGLLSGIGRPSIGVRLASMLAPILFVVAGLYGIAVWKDLQDAADTADIDAELILADDDVPLSAYADKGFGVYIKNVHQ
jgi:hypothetical protein